jgi:hypothetical protein
LDAAINMNRKKMGFGGDHKRWDERGIGDSVIAKAIAALKAAHFCRELGFHRMVMEGDALQMVQAQERWEELESVLSSY